MGKENQTGSDVAAFLTNAGTGRMVVELKRTQVFFSQGDTADCVFYLQKGRVIISAISVYGKSATIRRIMAGEFFGREGDSC